MTTIHWLGAGLSSGPGIQRLANGNDKLIVWCPRPFKAEAILADCTQKNIRTFSWEELNKEVSAGDVVVSMLPGTEHFHGATICLENNAHFVTSSYVTPQISDLHHKVVAKGLTFVNEVGLDPGLDHLLAHDLIESYKEECGDSSRYNHYFRSYCGGFPKIPNAFRYKCSWSALGVLKALKTPARWCENGKEQTTDAVWHSIQDYQVPLVNGTEVFQAYPNRDSIPFMQQYHIPKVWNVQQFVRGTLRLDGWSTVWSEIFSTIENTESSQLEAVIEALAEKLWEQNKYDEGEPDRVVLSVDYEVKEGDQKIWHKSYIIDEAGNERGSAMARLFSNTVSIAVEAVLKGDLAAGVLTAPSDRHVIHDWLDQLRGTGESIHLKNHL